MPCIASYSVSDRPSMLQLAVKVLSAVLAVISARATTRRLRTYDERAAGIC